MTFDKKTPGAEAPGVSREETLPNLGSVLMTSAGNAPALENWD